MLWYSVEDKNVVFTCIIMLLPVIAIGLLAIATLRGLRDQQNELNEQTDGALATRFARGLTLISCIATTFVASLMSSSDSRHGSLYIHLILWCVVIGPLTGLGGLAVFLVRARGMERLLGPVAALLTLSDIVFLTWLEFHGWF